MRQHVRRKDGERLLVVDDDARRDAQPFIDLVDGLGPSDLPLRVEGQGRDEPLATEPDQHAAPA
jgi:hypothetical protein